MAQIVHPVPPRSESTESAAAEEGPSSPHLVSSSSSAATTSRTHKIRQAVDQRDVEQLREMANETGGYETDELRRIVWPALLGCDVKGKGKAEERVTLDQLAMREDERQVQLDIARSLINYPRNVSENERDALRLRLEKAILTVLRKHPALQYFQGYHDIVSILLLTLDDDELLASATEQMSLHRIRDSMGPGLEPTLGYLKLAHRLIQRIDPDMYSLVNQAASMPFFALSWALTLFSHDLYEVAVIARLFDFLLAHNPAMISYLVVAILLTKKADLVQCLDQEDNDPAMVHSVLSQLPNLVLSEPVPPRPLTPPTPSSPTTAKPNSSGEDYRSEAESEALFSSPSHSTSDLSSSQLTSIDSSSTLDVSESLISLSEASPSSSALESGPSGLRQRRKVNRADRFSFSSFDSDVNALDDSMLSDPDIDNPGLSPFPQPVEDRSSPPIAPRESPPRPPSPGNDEFDRPQPRTVLVEDLIQSALQLWRTYPLTKHSSPPPTDPSSSVSTVDSTELPVDSSSPSSSINADTILGPNSCIFTYEASIAGNLSDQEAEEICRSGLDIVKLEALLPDPSPSEADEDDDEEDEGEDGFEFVGTTQNESKSTKSRRQKRRKSSLNPSSAINGRINLGPHGWLVVGGVAVATAVAYGVYGTRLGTGGLGLRTAGMGGGGGAPGVRVNPPPPASPATLSGEGAGELLKDWARGGGAGSTEL
ncbi:GTPase-activating protein GYP8 [Sporobolomyces salmoneus]|uniref:GTPase-activating protein GYP8 n=1 Tax=Sporobolomyces salmoneus TaxID=183962 RepID=UPI00317AFD31